MLKFLRRHRQKLLKENRVTQYLLYAIGEIILVVIGILIAIQINNWNEGRKLKTVEIQTLVEMQNSLQNNLKEVKKMAASHSHQIRVYSTLVDHLDQELPYHDSLEVALGNIFGWYTPLFDYASYETLKARGIELISNDSLKKSIVRVYENVLFRMTNGLEKFESENSSSVVLPFFSKNFELYSAIPSRVKANDYEVLKENKEYRNILKLLIGVRTFGLQLSTVSGQEIEKIAKEVGHEIKRLEKE